jgi:hypothetical protein
MTYREQESACSQSRKQFLDDGEDLAQLLAESERSLKALSGLSFKFESAYLAVVTARIAFQDGDLHSAIEALQETIERLNDLGVRDLARLRLALGRGSDAIQ